MRRERARLAGSAPVVPGFGSQPSTALDPGRAYAPVPYGGMTYRGAPYGAAPAYAAPTPGHGYGAPAVAGALGGYAPYPTGQHPAAAHPSAGPYPLHAARPHASAQLQYGTPYHPPLPVALPRVTWTRRQTGVAILSSWIGQTIMALATHFLVAYFLVVGFAFLLHVSGEPVDEFEADSLTSTIALWSMPERVWATALIGALLGGAVLALGAVVGAQWARAAGLAKAHRSAWLAWLSTTAATGLFGVMYWPGAIVFGMIGMVMSSSSSLTMGSMWETLLGMLVMAVVLTGGVGLLFGWLFLSTSRPRIDLRAIAEAEEAAARTRDEAELTRVRLRGEPG